MRRTGGGRERSVEHLDDGDGNDRGRLREAGLLHLKKRASRRSMRGKK
jgi:hypothetical protein